MTFVAAAVCPHPPLLVPEVGRGEQVQARAAAVDAVRRLCAARPNRIVVVGDAPAETRYGPESAGSLAGFGVDLRVPLGPSAAGSAAGPAAVEPALPLSLTVGAWLLASVGWSGERSALGVPAGHSPRAAAGLGERLLAQVKQNERLALLVMGDGSARRTLKAPGGLDERAAAFDAAAAAALAGPDPAALLDLDPALATELLAAGRAPWQVLAGALLAATRDDTPAEAWSSELTYDDAPYGVGYLVAVWNRGGAQRDWESG
ncbi:class III extradiol dioxygenase subunit B-like domain-containing protein [Frankia gtarii]|uniref:class III extradiol dioxygenase subunit B-like domain-containing protein n=1 Tax=Frankia gtarii TaxID=2950102 RepID=UPI0021BE5CE5|nr:class III extradiol dioxygenase subunit B-like domain-containing protein [Frankia gtarii]